MKKIKVGDVVKWKCTPYTRPSFMAEGIVREIFISRTLGEAVKVECVGEYLKAFTNRKRTTIAIYNII